MWQNLINILLKLAKTYDDLFILNEEKRRAVLEIDMQSLDKIINEEQKMVDVIISAEAERQSALRKMAEENSLINQLSNVKTLAAFCPGEYKEKFLSANEKLSASVKKTADLNDANRLLMRGALTAVNININSLAQMKADPDYKKNGNQYFSPQEKKLDFKI